MLVKKPIISLTSGSIAEAEISKMINEMNLGFAFEYNSYDSHFMKLKDYILEAYNEKMSCGQLTFQGNSDLIKNFSYKNLTKQLENLFPNHEKSKIKRG